jgi:hypothetical protein
MSTTNNSIVIQRPSHVVVHPLVLLSVVDHYRRAAINTKKRVVGVLLGNWNGQIVNITNSYAGTGELDYKGRILVLTTLLSIFSPFRGR